VTGWGGEEVTGKPEWLQQHKTRAGNKAAQLQGEFENYFPGLLFMSFPWVLECKLNDTDGGQTCYWELRNEILSQNSNQSDLSQRYFSQTSQVLPLQLRPDPNNPLTQRPGTLEERLNDVMASLTLMKYSFNGIEQLSFQYAAEKVAPQGR